MKIYDGSKIVPGILIFLAVISVPFWYNAMSGQATALPGVAVTNQSTECIESVEFMRTNHMNLLSEWRDAAIREDVKTYTASDGKPYDASLGTCLTCHSKTESCDTCHTYVGSRPNCWDCHNQTEGQTGASK